MSLGAYALRRSLGAALVLLVLVALLQFAVNMAMTRGMRGDADFFAIFELDRATWSAFPRDALIAVAAIAVLALAWRLAGALRQRAARADEVR
jgi:hypothetical protein